MLRSWKNIAAGAALIAALVVPEWLIEIEVVAVVAV